MKKIILGILILFCVGCGETRVVEATIISFQEPIPKTWGGCSEGKTIIQTKEGFIDYICGKIAPDGTKIKGYWASGSFDFSRNGFRRVN